MTEEEMAEKWVIENMDCCKIDNSVNQSIPYFSEEERCIAKGAFKNGVEFGYAKGYHDAEEHYMNVIGQVNEWHRIDEGKYPSKECLGKSFIVAFAFNKRTQEYYSFDCAEYVDKKKFRTHTNNDDKVLAWKEIIFPKD